jgi:hypothetical protein
LNDTPRFGQQPATTHASWATAGELLNARWPKARAAKCCAACGAQLRSDEHAVKQAGDAFHASCALYRPPSPLREQRKAACAA